MFRFIQLYIAILVTVNLVFLDSLFYKIIGESN